MKRLVSIFLITAMLCCYSTFAESFGDKTRNLIQKLNAQLEYKGVLNTEDLFIPPQEAVYNETYITNSETVDIYSILHRASNSNEIDTCVFATNTPENLFLAFNCCTILSLLTLTVDPNATGWVDLKDGADDAYNKLLTWLDGIAMDAQSAFYSEREYISPSLYTDFFTAQVKIEISEGYPLGTVTYVFEDKQPASFNTVYGNTPSASISDVMYVVNCQEWVSLRERANATSDRLAQVPFGATVTNVQDAGNGFYRCSYNGITGYIQARYLSVSPDYAPVRNMSTPYKGTAEQPWPDDDFWTMYPDYISFKGTRYASNSKTKTVGDYLFSVGSNSYKVVNCDSFVNLREEANAYSDSICEVPKGAKIQVNGELNGWMLCRYDGRYGWIKSGYLKKN